MKKETIKVTKTARYFLLGEPGPHIRRVWFVCHGYGQLADEFLKEFQVLDEGRHLVVAPEGLNRHYLFATRGKVGSSWMTWVDRLDDIADYLAFLDAVHAAVMNRLKPYETPLKITGLGFSQGAATISRWVLRGVSPFHRLILWGGDFPPETDWAACRQTLDNLDTHIVFGNKDRLMKPRHVQEQTRRLQNNNVNFQTRTFDGEHQIDPTVLSELAVT